MAILNYTGENIGLTDEDGNPVRVLPPIGKAIVTEPEEEILRVDDRVPIRRVRRGTIKYLPKPSGNLDPMYIVTKEVAEIGRSTRYDLLVVEDLVEIYGGNFYKKLINV